MQRQSLGSLIRERFRPPEWAVAFEVRDATGARGSRWADAVAVNCYPSRGLAVHGFECKESRNDWLRELKNPEKSIAVQRYCDHWWIVTTNATIVPAGELPESWGLLVANGRGLHEVVAAPKLQPQPMDRLFAVSLVRAMLTGMIPLSQINDRILEAQKGGREQERKSLRYTIDRVEQDLKRLQSRVHEFEATSGVSIDCWKIGRIASTIAWAKSGGLGEVRADLADAVDRCRTIADTVDAMLREWPIDKPAECVATSVGPEKGSGVVCRNGPESAAHKRLPTPFPPGD